MAIAAVAGYTGLSLAACLLRIHHAVQEVAASGSGGMEDMKNGIISVGEGGKVLEVLLSSKFTVVLLVNLGSSVFLLLGLITQAVFFGALVIQEVQKLMERLVNYILFKVLFVVAVVELESSCPLWIVWFILLGYLKVFGGLSRDRFERLCASPTASVWAHARAFTVSLLVLAADLFCIYTCVRLLRNAGVSTLLLLNFEAVIIALDTSQTVVQYALYAGDAMVELSAPDSVPNKMFGVDSAAWAEWRVSLLSSASLACDLSSLLLSLAHYAHIWCLHGLALHIIDALLFLNMRSLALAIYRRVHEALRSRKAMHNLRTAFPDATSEQLIAFDDDCAICKEPMSVAKRLPCAHFFHLACLRSWLDQGASSACSCPTCRSSLLGSIPGEGGPPPRPSPPSAPAGASGASNAVQSRVEGVEGAESGSREAAGGVEAGGWSQHAALQWTAGLRRGGRVGEEGGRSGGSWRWWRSGGREGPGAGAGRGLRFRGQRVGAGGRGGGDEAEVNAMVHEVEVFLPQAPRHRIVEVRAAHCFQTVLVSRYRW